MRTVTSRDIAIGTTGGQLYETSLEEKEKKEKPLKLLYDLSELNEPIVGLQVSFLLFSQSELAYKHCLFEAAIVFSFLK